ncbi:MAG: metal-dependent transcriptional regulator [Flavobacteriaceae bacterium]|nr:metal-dependent transcriptional regulator [Bacteroidia bacterium]NNL15320.1 metal-dependent transcriptional regulator [Flavobacteriaceae bacterium]
MVTLSEENYLKAIYHLSNHGSISVSTNAIAEKMETKASSVTDMIKKLADKNFVNYIKYHGASLTELGRLTAVLVIRKHRLWEMFLVSKLNFSWDEVHNVAEQLEHIKSEKLINELDAFLEFPTHDPHGDPIPDKNGNINTLDKVPLSTLQENQGSKLLSVKDSSDEFLRFLNKRNISIGDTINVLNIEPYDKSVQIRVNSKEMTITENVAENLYVKNVK